MTRNTKLSPKLSWGLLAFAALFAGFVLGLAPAHAQSACAPEDLACRVSALESRLAALEGRQQQTATQTEALQRAQPNLISVTRRCAANCAAEAQDVCVSRGFAGGTPEDWNRDRGASSLTLTRASCTR